MPKKFTDEQLSVLRRLVSGNQPFPSIQEERMKNIPNMDLIKLIEGLRRQVFVAESTLESRTKH